MRYILFFLFITLMACQEEKQNVKASLGVEEIPDLLDRHAKLQQGKEWENIQNLYVGNRQKISQNPKDQEARLKLAELFMNEARITGEHGHYYPAALTLIDQILESSIENKDQQFRTLANKASVLLSLHQFQEALTVGQEAIAINPYNAQIYGVLVDAYVELGNYEEAVKMADKMISIRPDLRSYARVSYLREIHGDISGAIEAMELAVAAGYPGYEQTAWIRLTLGELFANYGQLEKAKQQFQIILQTRPDYPFAIAALANIAREEGNFEEAESLLKKACTIIPEVGFYHELALLYRATNREAMAQEIVEEILIMLKDDVEHGHEMDLEYAELYLSLNDDPEQALTYAETAYKKRPENIDVNRMLARIYYKKGASEKAQEYFEKASRTQSKHPELASLKMALASL